MCEVLAVRWPKPVAFLELMPWAEKMEYYGLGSFGWGVAWLDGSAVRCYRYPGRLSEDPAAREQLASVSATHYLIHFRRPTRLGTTQLADTQPFLAGEGRFAFCHNGFFNQERRFRDRYRSRLKGKADSEVGFLMFEDLVNQGLSAQDAIAQTHEQLQGDANIGYLGCDGEIVVYNAYPKNRLHRFGVDSAEVAATELHSPDDSLFRLIFPEATSRRTITGAARL